MDSVIDTSFRKLSKIHKEELITSFFGIYYEEHKKDLLVNNKFIEKTMRSYVTNKRTTLQERRDFIEEHFKRDITRLFKGIELSDYRYLDLLDSIYIHVWYVSPEKEMFKELGISAISNFKRLFKRYPEYLDYGSRFFDKEKPEGPK